MHTKKNKLMLERAVTNFNVWIKEERISVPTERCRRVFYLSNLQVCKSLWCLVTPALYFCVIWWLDICFEISAKKCSKVICIAIVKFSFSEKKAAALCSRINTQTIFKTWPLIPSSQYFYWLQGSHCVWGTRNGLWFHSLEQSRLLFRHRK